MPFIVPLIPVIVAAAGAAVAAYGAYQQGQAQKKAADFNAQVASQNAAISRSNAAAAAQQEDRNTYLRLGAIKANIGASGGTGGSALDMLGDVAAQSTLQRQNVLYQGELEARGYKNTSALDTFSGKEAAKAGTLAAGAALLQGAGTAASMSSSIAPASSAAAGATSGAAANAGAYDNMAQVALKRTS